MAIFSLGFLPKKQFRETRRRRIITLRRAKA
jgi:hypothetical protein